jgi:hypothetical protein
LAQGWQCLFRLCERGGRIQAKRENLQHESHSVAENHLHTTHKSSSGQIYYKFHPDFGKEVVIVRRFKDMAGNNIQIQLPDSTRLELPDWMLDEHACLDIQERDRPCIAIAALNHLRRVLTAQPLLQRVRGSILPAQDANAKNQTATTNSVSAGGDGTKSFAGSEDKEYRVTQPDASRSNPEKAANKKGGRK